MRVNVIMPQLGESVAEGTIIKWLKSAGDLVERDENILEISTDKVDSEIPSPATGILVEILAQEGETIPIGKPIAVIETEAAQAQALPKAATPTTKAKETEPKAAYAAEPGEVKVVKRPEAKPETTREGKRFYSPLVKKMAEAEGITPAELDRISGSGAEGRVTKQDAINYLEKRKAAPARIAPKLTPVLASHMKPAEPPLRVESLHVGAGEEIVPMDIMRKRIAEHMVKSAFTAPHVTSVSEADLTHIVHFRERNKTSFEAREGFKLTYTPIIIEATIKALKDFPYLNASIDGENIILKHYVNFGVAVALENGLIVPVIKGADGMNLLALARAVNELSSRARSKRLSPDDVHGSTFSMTNPGIFGNLMGTPIINQPNVAILGTGAIQKRAIVLDNDAIAVRSMIYLSLSYDHRIIDGALGGQFLQRLVYYLESFDPNTTI